MTARASEVPFFKAYAVQNPSVNADVLRSLFLAVTLRREFSHKA